MAQLYNFNGVNRVLATGFWSFPMFSARPPIHAPLCESERESVCVRERAGVHTFEGTGGFSNIFDWIIHSHFKQKSGW